jgi:hypothetical protein
MAVEGAAAAGAFGLLLADVPDAADGMDNGALMLATGAELRRSVKAAASFKATS